MPVDLKCDWKILLAEDHSEDQHLLLLALARGQRKLNVTVVGTGAEFLHTIRLQAFDCAILDYRLPDYCADDLLCAAAENLKGCPVLVVSNHDDEQILTHTTRYAAAAFLPKAVALRGHTLWERVTHVVNEARKAHEERRKIERRERHLAALAETDQLTGLYNRCYFERCMTEQRWTNDRREWIACLKVKLDDFNRINDEFSPKAGDELFKTVTDAINVHANKGEVVILWDPGEIMILKPAGALLDEWLWAESLRQRIESLVIVAHTTRLHITASIGLHRCRSRSFSEATVNWADEAIDLAKEHGRNVVCTSEMVAVRRNLSEVSNRSDLTVGQQRQALLRRLYSRLGPTQWEHITDHCEKVSEMAVRIARLLDMTSDVTKIRIAGLMHDIGKCVIPEELLAKPRSLSAQEWRLMARHDVYGAWITGKFGVDDQTTRYIQQHHQRFDSSPTRIRLSCGARTKPDGASVLCVADAFVTMLTSRSYRLAMTIPRALEELQRESGKQFDPDVVEALSRSREFTRRAA